MGRFIRGFTVFSVNSLCCQLAIFFQFWSEFGDPLDQCKSDEKILGGGGVLCVFLVALDAQIATGWHRARVPFCQFLFQPEFTLYFRSSLIARII